MRARFYYGYIILVLCFLNMVFVRGAFGSFSVFYVALLEDFHWSHAVGASIVSLNSLVYASVSPAVGYAFDRLGPRVLLPSAGFLMGLGFFFSGFSDSLWELYIYYGILAAVGQGGLGFVTNSALISKWFVRRRATAIGLAVAGQGFGMIAIVPLAQILISRVGWRGAFMLLGVLIVATVVPMNAIFQRRSPEEIGQLPDGNSVAHGARSPASTSAPNEFAWSLAKALRSSPFWILAAGHLALGTGLFIVYTHVVAHLVHQGSDKLTAAFALGVLGLTRVAGTFAWGYASDLLGRWKAYGLSVLITSIGLFCLIAIGSGAPLWFIYTAAVLYGTGHSAGNPTYGAVIGDIFSGKNIGTILGFLEITFGLGMALGSWSGGAIFDATGSYRLAFTMSVVCFVISFLAIHAGTAWHENRLRAGRTAGETA
ncbi:MAG TPA: MFS transporter [Candidatus Binatia bacterium]|jgi:MFS family permease